jgi:hypothetical protein
MGFSRGFGFAFLQTGIQERFLKYGNTLTPS